MDENGIFKRTTLVTRVRPNRKVATCCNHQKRKALGWSLKPIFCGCLTWRFFNANSLLMQNPLGNVLLKPPRAGDWRKICGNQNARSEWNISESIKVESKQDEARCSEDGKEPPDIAERCQTCLGAPSLPRAIFFFFFFLPWPQFQNANSCSASCKQTQQHARCWLLTSVYICLPVLPHKAVAEVSKIENL